MLKKHYVPKLAAGLAVLGLLACKSPGSNSDAASIPDDTVVSIPDANFRRILSSYGITPNADGEFAYSQVKGLKSLSFSITTNDSQKVADITGIEYFTALKNFSALRHGSDDPAIVWDFSKNKNLETISLWDIKFAGKLALGDLPKLKEFSPKNIKLTGVFEAGSLPALEKVDFNSSSNIVKSFNFSKAPKLVELHAYAAVNDIEEIDLSHNTALKEFLLMNSAVVNNLRKWETAKKDLQKVIVSQAQKEQLDKADGGSLSGWINRKDFGPGLLFPNDKPDDFDLVYEAR